MQLNLMISEQSVLNCLIEKPEYISQFDRDYFLTPIAKDLYLGIKEASENNVALTNENLIIFAGKYSELITKEMLRDLRSIKYDVNEFPTQFKILKENWAKRNLENKILKETLLLSTSKDRLNKEAFLSLRDSITENLEMIEGKKSLLLSPEEMYNTYKTIIVKRNNGEKFSSGDSYLDRYMTMGFAPQYMTSCFAGTGEGKSMYALNLVNKQINLEIPCLYISLENSLEMTMDRLISLRSEIDFSRFYSKEGEELDQEVVEAIEKEKRNFDKMEFFRFVDEPNLNMDDCRMIVREFKKKTGSKYVNVFLDLYSQLQEFSSDITPQKIETGVNKWHEIVKGEFFHSFNILQANRSQENKPKTINEIERLRPNLDNIKNSAAFGERSRVVLSLFRPKYYAERIFGAEHPEVMMMDDICRVRIEKQNAGISNFDLKYLYVASRCKFYKYVEPNKEMEREPA